MRADTGGRLEGLKADLDRGARRRRVDLANLKSGGFIKQTQPDLFTVRLRCPGGMVTSEQLQEVARLAEKYGSGEVHMSVRMSLEILHVQIDHFDDLVEELGEAGLSVASCGPRVRVPTACGGCRYNPNGLTDTQRLCTEVDEAYFGTPTGHHKFKISFAGCPIDCVRTRGMDLGFQGIVEPRLLREECTGCGLCEAACDERALEMVDGYPVREESKCLGCGDCIKVCPSGAMVTGRIGWLVRVGGKHGKHPLEAVEIARFVPDDKVLEVVDTVVRWYQENGEGRERIGHALNRLGFESLVRELSGVISADLIRLPAG